MVGERVTATLNRIMGVPNNAIKTMEEARPANASSSMTGTVINTGKRAGQANRSWWQKMLHS